MCIFLRTLQFAHPTYVKIHVGFSRIGTLVVVEKRAVIERYSRVRVVVVKFVMPKDQTLRKYVRQKQRDPGLNQHLIFVETAPCKNSQTSCLESRRKVLDGVESIKIRKLHCLYAATSQYYRDNQAIEDGHSSNPHSTQNDVVQRFHVLMNSLPGIVDGARKTSQVGRLVRGAAPGRRRRISSLPMLEATSSRDQCIIECCNLCRVASWCERKLCGPDSTTNTRS